jgi:hypothetical protein
MTIRRALALLLLLPAVGCGATGSTGGGLGDEGGPVNLTVGYQP